MKMDHLVFTRFCYRDAFKHLKGRGEAFDPLDPAFLGMHMSLLEMVCLPSILSQTNQQFAWVIIVDKDLPSAYRDRIEEMGQSRERTHIVEFRGNDLIVETNWIKHLVLPGTDYLITTMFDDDDALPVDYVEQLRKSILDDDRSGQVPPAKIIAAKQIIQWELTFSPLARYGFKCPWHRMQTQASSCGFSLACKFPELTFSVLGLKHVIAFNYLSFEQPPAHRLVEAFRQSLLSQCRVANLPMDTALSSRMNVDLSAKVGPVLMTNHEKNSEQTRLSERKATYEVVEGPETFKNFAIDWAKVAAYSNLFRKSGAIDEVVKDA